MAVWRVQDSNPRIKSGEIPRYTGIGNCFTRVAAEQGAVSLPSATHALTSAAMPVNSITPHVDRRGVGAEALQSAAAVQVSPRSGAVTWPTSSGERHIICQATPASTQHAAE